METLNEKQTEALNDLIKINHDRMEGYDKAIRESAESPYLIPTFNEMKSQSSKNNLELRSRVNALGGTPASENTIPGKIYHAWMDVKTTFSKSPQSVLDLCEFGEDAALKAYETALKSENDLDEISARLVSNQNMELKKSHEIIKSMRDKAKNIHQSS
jgi:uncharacterized protein (TIGR02284 family)